MRGVGGWAARIRAHAQPDGPVAELLLQLVLGLLALAAVARALLLAAKGRPRGSTWLALAAAMLGALSVRIPGSLLGTVVALVAAVACASGAAVLWIQERAAVAERRLGQELADVRQVKALLHADQDQTEAR